MQRTNSFFTYRSNLLSVGVLLLALGAEAHIQRVRSDRMLETRSFGALLLALGSNTLVPRSVLQNGLQNQVRKGPESIMLASESDGVEPWDEVQRLKIVLELNKKTFGPDDEITLTSMNAYAIGLEESGQIALAQGVLEELCDLARTKLDKGHAQTILALSKLADVQVMGGHFSPLRLAEAARLKREVVDIKRNTLGREDPETRKTFEEYKAILAAIAEIEGEELDEDDFLRLGFEESTVDEVARDFVDACTSKLTKASDYLKDSRNYLVKHDVHVGNFEYFTAAHAHVEFAKAVENGDAKSMNKSAAKMDEIDKGNFERNMLLVFLMKPVKIVWKMLLTLLMKAIKQIWNRLRSLRKIV